MFIFDKITIKMIHTYVITSNQTSIHAFTEAGYLPVEDLMMSNQEAVRIIFRRCFQA